MRNSQTPATWQQRQLGKSEEKRIEQHDDSAKVGLQEGQAGRRWGCRGHGGGGIAQEVIHRGQGMNGRG